MLRGEGSFSKDFSLFKKGFLLPRNEKLSDIGALHYQEGTCLLVDWETLRSLS